MGWFEKCIDTYNHNLKWVGQTSGSIVSPLVPLFYISMKMNSEITLSEDGEFLSARQLEKEEMKTMIPATEASGSRTSGISALPLCDNLGYIGLYINDSKYQKKFDNYLEQLTDWAESPYSHPLIRSVLTYIQKGTIVSDLIQCGSLKSGFEPKKEETHMVRFCMRMSDGEIIDCWDESVVEAFGQYYMSKTADAPTLCYATGQKVPLLHSHPKGVYDRANGAKIISANDSYGFTYRGRFSNEDEAYCLGGIASQKAHNALRWVVANQGKSFGNRVFVAWNTTDIAVPSIGDLKYDDDEIEEQEVPIDVSYREKVKKMLYGTGQIGSDIDRGVQIMALEAATTGRLSVTYYNELSGSDYLSRLQKWYDDCCWEFYRNGKKCISSPNLLEIADFAFGAEKGSFVESSPQVRSEQAQTIFHCIIDGAPIPRSILCGLMDNCRTRQAFSHGNYERLLSVACSILKKHYKDTLKKEISMKLDTTNTDRSYLFGRLLAVAERIERTTYAQSEQGRETNAARLQAAFVQHPMHTWSTLESLLIPYYAKLSIGLRTYFKNMIADIMSLLEEKDIGILNKQLDDIYLIGYYLQRKDFYTNKKTENEEE